MPNLARPPPTMASSSPLPVELSLKALRVSESRYRRLFETAQDGILLLNADTAQIEDVNPHLIEMLGYSHAEFLGKKLWEVGAFADIAQSKEMFAELQATGYVRYDDLPLKTHVGIKIAVEFICSRYDCDGIKVIQCNVRNITERHTDRAKIQRHLQLHAALSQSNKSIVNSANEEELFFALCRAAVTFGGMKMAWIGLVDARTRIVHPAASFGDDTEHLKSLTMSIDANNVFGRGPTGIAIRENRIFWCQDLLLDPVTIPWREGATKLGLAASATLPLHRQGAVVGAFTLYTSDANAFDASARDLLTEMAYDVSLALDNFSRESRRVENEEEIRLKNTILQTQQETSLDGILVVDREGHVISCNQRFADLWQLTPEIVATRLNAPLQRAIAAQVENSESFFVKVKSLNQHRGDRSREEVRFKDGRVIDMYSAPVTGPGQQHYGRVWYLRDITQSKRAAQTLLESERRFSDLLGNVELISLMLDRNARITYCNEYLLRLTGWKCEEVIGQNWCELFIAPEQQHLRDSLFQQILANQPAAMHDENEVVLRSGSRRLIRWSNTVLRSSAGDAIGTASIGEDITARKDALDRVKYLNRVYAVLGSINALIVRVRDRSELFNEACRIAVEVGGFRMALIALVDQTAGKVVPVATAGVDAQLLTALEDRFSLIEGSAQGNPIMTRTLREKKSVVINNLQSNPEVIFRKEYAESDTRSVAVFPLIVADEAVGVLVIYAGEVEFFQEEELKLLTDLAGDIAFAIDHIDKQEQLDYLAYYDVLTGLANRQLFRDRVAQFIRTAQNDGHQLALILIDLERFKNINDSLGRPAGDALLRQVAQWLKQNFGDAGVLARMGADHFAVILPKIQTDHDVAEQIKKMLHAFQQHPFRLNDAVFRVSVKVGAALYPCDGADTDTLLMHAEAAIKKAKSTGEKYLFYTQKMTQASAKNLSLENQLRLALDNEEFVLHYQPKVNLASGLITGAEALIRWNDPRTGLVPPGDFIPILEETGLIFEVGNWALRRAIADHLSWQAAGLTALRIAVNVSPLQLRHRDFIAGLEKKVGVHINAASGLELEITESLIMEDIKYNIASLQAIRAMGIHVAIDDFGTGFSSLSYLAKLPVDSLKIDRSFVTDMSAEPQGLALVSTIINLAHALKLGVVAEGVETDEQLRLLRLLGCDEMQGFLFSKPLPKETFEAKFMVMPAQSST